MKKEEHIFHSKTKEDTLSILQTSSHGLSKEKAKSRIQNYGYNKLPEKKHTSRIIVFIRQFKSLMIYILLMAAGISYYLERTIDVYVIGAVILINAIIGYYQEDKAEQAIKALKKMIVPKAKVIRSNELFLIPASELVPGDIIQIEEGDRIPADSRIIEYKNLRTVESSLTGESFPVDKTIKVFPEKTAFADRRNMVFLGTFVASGHAKAVVTYTGANTQIGKLATSLESIVPKKSHFQEKTDTLAKYLAIIAFAGALITFFIGYFFRDFELGELFLFTLASLVSGIPEGLPAVLAIVLAIGAFRMAKKNAIIREKYATETLGIVSTIITDKTGTLTQNTMTIQSVFLPGQNEITITGRGWEPKGSFSQNNKQIVPLENIHLNKLLHIASLCNNSKLIKKENDKDHYEIIGDPTEAALLVLSEKAGLKKHALEQKEKRIDDLPFSSELKYRASLSVLSQKEKHKEIYIVGAPEAVMKYSTFVLKNGRKTKLINKDITHINKKIDSLTNKAMRVLALAYKEVPNDLDELSEKNTNELILVGIVGMNDPPREEVKEAIEKAKKAGIRTIMATGDHKNTAIAIAREINLIPENQNKKYPLAYTGQELQQMSKKDFENAITNVSVFARLTPETKLKIAKTLQDQGQIVAMTGDGVNDAPALKQADIGVSMGIIGTDVARESSSMILADDNFASIINAIEEGRTVFTNTKQTSFFLATTSIAEDVTIIATLAIGLPLPLLPTQILWLNVVTGSLTTVALASEKSHHSVLEEKPRNKNQNILNKELFPFVGIITLLMLAITIVAFNYYLPNESKARTAAFAVMSFTQLFNMVNLRSLNKSIFKIGLLSNRFITGAFIISTGLLMLAIYLPFLQGVFGFSTLSFKEIGFFLLISSSVFFVGEAYKFTRNHKFLNRNPKK